MASLFSALLFYVIIIPVSLLPFPLLYAFSDFIFVILYYVIPYRKKIVLDNLRRSFPEKDESELLKIRRRFYRHFCDLVVESLKLFTATPSAIRKRVELVNSDLLEKYYHQGKSLILATGHYANWEWPAITLPYHSSHTATGIYKKLSNPFFDKRLRVTRAKFGMKLMSTREVARFFEDHKDELCTYGFINDQSPSDPKRGHWMKFLNQDTCMLLGVESYAVKYDFPVLYAEISRVSRGHYRIEYKVITDRPKETKEFEITEACSRMNEEIIRRDPAYWLWTHRRWKHRR